MAAAKAIKLLAVLVLGAWTIQPLQAQAGVGNSMSPQQLVTWTSATAANTTLVQPLQTINTGTAGGASGGYSTAMFSINESGSITGGVVTFEVTTAQDGNSNWQALNCYQMGATNGTYSAYPLVTGSGMYQCPGVGATYARARLSTPVSGTGSVAVVSQGTSGLTIATPGYTSASSLTATINGAAIVEKGPRWQVNSSPAAAAQATASKAAGTGTVRHVADCITFASGSIAAPAATALNVNLRDGATGAGTVIWTAVLGIPASAGQNTNPTTLCGLNLVGSATTAMTLEFSAGLASLSESVSLSGYDVQ